LQRNPLKRKQKRDFSKASESANTINQWVESQTNNKIKRIISPDTIDGATMVLVNAIHFKGEWTKKFPHSEKSDFWLNAQNSVQTDMMYKTEHFPYVEFTDLDATAIEMPYKDSEFSMMILLPNERDGLQKLESKLETTDLMEKATHLKKENVKVQIPKFKVEFDIKLNDVLKDMGMPTMFSRAADLTELVDGENVFVSEVAHKAFIECDETGTEAAGATYGAVMNKAGHVLLTKEPPKEFIVDHPFVFVIKDNMGIYFIGHVAKF